MSSIVIDEESFEFLIKLVETKIFNCKYLKKKIKFILVIFLDFI